MIAPITCGAGRPWRSSSRTGRTEPRSTVGADDAVAREVEAVGVGLQPVAQRDARHGEPAAGDVDEAAQRVELVLVEAGNVLGDDRADAARRRTRDRWWAGTRRRPPPGASACAYACAGCSARRAARSGPPPGFGAGRRADGMLDGVDDRVEGGARAHRRGDQLVVGEVVAADVDRRALHLVELARRSASSSAPSASAIGANFAASVGVVGLLRQLPGPVEGEVEVAAAVVELVHLARRATGSRRAPSRWRGRGCRRAAARSRCRSSARGTRATPRARGTRRASPSAGGSPSRTAARAWAPSRRRRSRTGRRRSSAARSRASWRWCRAP